MEKRTLTKIKHTYRLANPYNGGAQALAYQQTQIEALVIVKNLLSTRSDVLQLLVRNPINLN